ncbi:carbohydrate-selective porin oprb family [Akkermansia glycaniphila]|uniref:Carbohydrate-selective porin oprb family n=2 Tax=Akkermansia glycaniphila TaxID=1679444 RepID=A0A1H6KLK2_9BACT|nr:carbohydrate-selective porin oprb family [Akkermansia glycaniphila]
MTDSKMKTTTYTTILGLAFTLASFSSADEAKGGSQASADNETLITGINQFGSEYGDDKALFPSDAFSRAWADVHARAYERYGLEWVVETAFSAYGIRHAAAGSADNQSWHLLHVQANWQFLPEKETGGTWLRVELSGSTALNGRTWRSGNLNEAIGVSNSFHTDTFGYNEYFIPEVAVMQYFADRKGCLIFGMVNQTNYFDANSYANSSFGQFTNAAFVNSQVVPLTDSNFGLVLQGQFSKSVYGMIGGSFLENDCGYSPFKHTTGKAFNVIGEIGYVYDGGAIRFTPFVARAQDEGVEHDDCYKTYGGLSINVEHELTERLSVFSRVGWSSSDHLNTAGASCQCTAGVILHRPWEVLTGMEESEGNFLGVALSVTRPDRSVLGEGCVTKDREIVLECSYRYAITPYLSLHPTYQYIKNPSQRPDTHQVQVYGIQAVLTF